MDNFGRQSVGVAVVVVFRIVLNKYLTPRLYNVGGRLVKYIIGRFAEQHTHTKID